MIKYYYPIIIFYSSLFFNSSCALEPGNTDLLRLDQVSYWAYNIADVNTQRQYDQLVGSHFDLYVLDPVVTEKGEEYFDIAGLIKNIKNYNLQTRGVEPVVLAYVDIGQAERWRWYWEENWTLNNPSWLVGADPDGWVDIYTVAYWAPEWKDITIYGYRGQSHLEAILKAGFDGIYMDWVEGYDDYHVKKAARRDGIDPVKSMFDFIEEIRHYARSRSIHKNPDFLIVPKNASDLYERNPARYRRLMDAIAVEAIWYDGDGGDEDWDDPAGYNTPTNSLYPGWTEEVLEDLRVIKNHMPVFCAEYAQDIGGNNFATDAYANAAAEGFVCYATRRCLKQLSKTPYPDGYAPADY